MLEASGEALTYSSFSPTSNSAWRDRQEEYRDILIRNGDSGKHTYISAALGGLPLNCDCIDNALAELERREQDSDFSAGQLIRLLYLLNPSSSSPPSSPPPSSPSLSPPSSVEVLTSYKDKILAVLLAFPWWPSTPTAFDANSNTQKLCFWSENHVLMSLGAAHLGRQYKAIQNAKARVSSGGEEENGDWMVYAEEEVARVIASTPGARLEEKLLRHFLSVRTSASFDGLYETLSHVYLPYTVSALFNLYDFSLDQTIRVNVHTILDNTLQALLMVTDSNGISTLTASARGFDRMRRRVRGHNINNLVRMLVGTSPEPFCGSAISDYLTTTSWRPRTALMDCFHLSGRVALPHCSHSVAEFDDVYASADTDLTPIEMTPFAWSAGLVLHPAFAARTKLYLKVKNMTEIQTLAALRFVPSFLAGSIAQNLNHLSEGQSYCGIHLNIYKSTDVVLTSLYKFNIQKCGFQQLPWCLNFAGSGPVLLCSYVAPSHLTRSTSITSSVLKLGYESWVVWPAALFEECEVLSSSPGSVCVSPVADKRSSMFSFGAKASSAVTVRGGVWRVAKRRGWYVGLLCTRQTEECSKRFDDTRIEARLGDIQCEKTKQAAWEGQGQGQGQERGQEQCDDEWVSVQCHRIICRDKACSWVLVLGSEPEFENLQEFFLQRLLPITINESHVSGKYVCCVRDPNEGDLLVDSSTFG